MNVTALRPSKPTSFARRVTTFGLLLLVAAMLLSSPVRNALATSQMPTIDHHVSGQTLPMSGMDAQAMPCDSKTCADMTECETICALSAAATHGVCLMPSASLPQPPESLRLAFKADKSPLSRWRPDSLLRPPIA